MVRPVKMMTIGAGAAGGEREYPGRVRAAEEIQLSFEVPGRVVELNAREGSSVTAGTLLAALDPRDFEADRDRVLARRNETRADYQRNRALYERDAISLRDLEVVRRQFEVAEANLRQAQKAVDDTRLYAPFAGKIASRLVETQENVTAKQPILVFHDDSSLEIRASFPESDFLRIRDIGSVEEMTARLQPRVEISAAGGLSIDAWVKELRGTADPVTRTYDVTLGFTPPAGQSITSGMTARVVIAMQGAAGTLLVPATAVVSNAEGQSLVWIYDETGGVVNAREVVIGLLTGDEIEILSGLEDGDTIAILGANQLTEGMHVRPLGD
jgi:RND family efflux transporter MFP subunit